VEIKEQGEGTTQSPEDEDAAFTGRTFACPVEETTEIQTIKGWVEGVLQTADLLRKQYFGINPLAAGRWLSKFADHANRSTTQDKHERNKLWQRPIRSLTWKNIYKLPVTSSCGRSRSI
jgi:hypothetical protein